MGSGAYYETAVRNSLAFQELSHMLRRLAAEGVLAILLKGAALAETVYGNAALRPMADLDILVRREDVPTVLGVLAASGYAATGVEPHAGAAVAYESQVMWRKPGPVETLIEIHWSLFDSPYYQHKLPMDWFWQTARPVRMGDASALVLGPAAQVLHLCAHLWLHHRGEGLLWLHDVAEVIVFYQGQIDWGEVLARAQAYDLVLPLQQVLTRLVGEWDVPLPGDVLEQLHALRASPAEGRVFTWLTAEHRPVARRFWIDLASLPGWQQRLRFAWTNLFPSPDYMRSRYRIPHPLLVPVYYPYRWFLGLRSALS